MPYNFVGLGATRVQNDLRVMGVYSGTSTAVSSAAMSQYPGGRSVAGQTGTYAASAPGTAADGFCYPLTSKTLATLYQQGGWACYWRAMTWIANSCTSAPIWDGTRYWLPTCSNVTGNWIGQSQNGSDWNFVQITGSQSGSSLNGYGIGFKGECLFTDIIGGVSTVHYSQGPNLMNTRAMSAGSFGIYGGFANDSRVVFTGNSGRIWTNTTVDGPWTEYVLGGVQWNAATNVPGTQIWIIVGTGGAIARSTNDMTTIPTSVTVGSAGYQGVAASSTAIIAVGGTTMQRSIDNGATWQPVTGLPITTGSFVGVGYGNGTFVVGHVNSANVMVSTDDGLTWVSRPTNFPSGLSAYVSSQVTDGVRFAGGKFTITTSGNTANTYVMAQSTDGQTWEVVMTAPPNPNGTNAQYGTQGVFAATNTAGTPTTSSRTTGFHVDPRPPTQNSTLVTYNVGVNLTSTQPAVGVNQWHEFQVIARPAVTLNEWDLTYVIDGAIAATVTTTGLAAQSTKPLWFTIARSAAFTYTQDIVFLDFPMAQDPGLLGPDLRIYYDQPATDVSIEWSPLVDGAHNAEMVAATSITNAATYVYESDAPKTDEYTMKPTNVPLGFGVVSTKNEAYFSRMQGVTANASVGVDIGGTIVDASPQPVAAPVNSWTYVSQLVENDPQTGNAWSRQKLNEAQLRIARRAPSPGGDPYWLNVKGLLSFDGTNGQTTALDTSSYANQVGLSPGANLSDAQKKFGNTSLALNISSQTGQYATMNYPAGTFIGTSPFTIEGWFYLNTLGSWYLWQTNYNNLSTDTRYDFYVNTNGTLGLVAAANNSVVWTTTTALQVNQWYHLAVTRDASNLVTCWINGVSSASATNAQSLASGSSSSTFGIGRVLAGATSGWRGYIDEFRITDGVARYTAAFTPPTAPFPNFY